MPVLPRLHRMQPPAGRTAPYEALYFVLRYRDRQVLYDRINARVDAMLAAGLVEEARQAYAACGPTARQPLGTRNCCRI